MKGFFFALLILGGSLSAADSLTSFIDFYDLFRAERIGKIEIFNQDDTPTSIDLRIQSVVTLGAKEKRTITIEPGFSFCDTQSSTLKIINPMDIQNVAYVAQQSTIAIGPNQRIEVTAPNSHFISHLKAMKRSVLKKIIDGKINIFLGNSYEDVELFDRYRYTRIMNGEKFPCWGSIDLYSSPLKAQEDFLLKHGKNLVIVDMDGFLTKYPRREDFFIFGRELTTDDLITSNIEWLLKMVDQSHNYIVFSSAYEEENHESNPGPKVTLSFLKRIFSLFGRAIAENLTFVNESGADNDGVGHIYFGQLSSNVFMASGRYPHGKYWDRKSSAINIMKNRGYEFSGVFLFDDSQHQRHNFIRDMGKRDGVYSSVYNDISYSIYDEKLTRVSSTEELKLKHMFYSLPGFAESYHSSRPTLKEIFKIIREKNIKAFLFPGKSGYFLYSILNNLKQINSGLLDTDEIIPELISVPFSGSPGNPDSSSTFTQEQRDSLFSFWERQNLGALAGENICLLDCVATGNGLRSFLHNFLLFYNKRSQALPSVTFISLKNYGDTRTTNDAVIFTVDHGKLSFKTPLLKAPQNSREKFEPLLVNEFDYALLPFPVVHDANDLNGYHTDDFSKVRSLHSKDWHRLDSVDFSEGTEKSRWFEGSIVPEYISLMFTHSPAREYESLKRFRGPQFPRNSILAAFLNLCFRNEIKEIYKAQAFHYKNALNVLNGFPSGSSSIQHSTHRVWLSRDGQEPPEWATDFYIGSVEKHPELEHVLWCQNKADLGSTIEKLSRSSVKVNVREVGEIRDQMKGVEMYDSLIRQGYFVMACDILRLEVLRLFGGLYTDYGYEIKANITNLLDKFDIITNQFVNINNPLDTHCDTNILAAKKGNQIIERFLSFMTNFEMARLIKEKICEAFKKNHGLCNPWTHGPYFSAFLYSNITPQEKLLVLSGYDEVLEKKHMGTWWAGTHGNKSITRDGYPVI